MVSFLPGLSPNIRVGVAGLMLAECFLGCFICLVSITVVCQEELPSSFLSSKFPELIRDKGGGLSVGYKCVGRCWLVSAALNACRDQEVRAPVLRYQPLDTLQEHPESTVKVCPQENTKNLVDHLVLQPLKAP